MAIKRIALSASALAVANCHAAQVIGAPCEDTPAAKAEKAMAIFDAVIAVPLAVSDAFATVERQHRLVRDVWAEMWSDSFGFIKAGTYSGTEALRDDWAQDSPSVKDVVDSIKRQIDAPRRVPVQFMSAERFRDLADTESADEPPDAADVFARIHRDGVVDPKAAADLRANLEWFKAEHGISDEPRPPIVIQARPVLLEGERVIDRQRAVDMGAALAKRLRTVTPISDGFFRRGEYADDDGTPDA